MAPTTEIHFLTVLKSRSPGQGLAWSVSGENSLSGLQTAASLLCFHTVERETLDVSLLLKAQILSD